MNFKEIKLKDLEGNEAVYDVSKSLGNIIYQSTADLGMLDVAQQIYKKGSIDLTDEAKEELLRILSDTRTPLIAVVKQELINRINGLKNK